MNPLQYAQLPAIRTVCVTGAAGFLASWTVATLLERGYRVHGTVRSLGKGATHLTSLPGAPEQLRLFEADLEAEGSFSAAIEGCDAVLHMASPYRLDVRNPQRDLVDPAVNGTRNVLGSCLYTPSVRRVVLTSSMAAVTDQPDGRVLTAADWNTSSSLRRNPYYLSKTLAEREAWDYAKSERADFDLVSINPFMVIGPSRTADLNTSNKVLADLWNGVYPAIFRLNFGIVDVRDVAEAHVRALENPAAKGRYLLSHPAVSMRELITWLRESAPGRKNRLPSLRLDTPVGDRVLWLASFTKSGGVGSYLRTHVGRIPRFDTSPAEQELGMTWRPLRDTVRDTLQDLERWKHV